MIPSVDLCPRLLVTPGQPFRDSRSERPAIQSDIHNVTTYTTSRRGQTFTLEIIFDITSRVNKIYSCNYIRTVESVHISIQSNATSF